MIGGNDQDRNQIHFNRDGGITLLPDKTSLHHTISRNEISKNYRIGPQIDLDNNAYTDNDIGDEDIGVNTLLNFSEYLQSFPMVPDASGANRYWTWGRAPSGQAIELYQVATEDVTRGMKRGGGDFFLNTGAITDGTFSVDPSPRFHATKAVWVTTLSFDNQGNTSEYAVNNPAGPDNDMDGIVDEFEKGAGFFSQGSDPDKVDSDGDGLPDSVEDRNRNGIYEPELGETSATLADTDGDGLNDWSETHGDGIYDPGEDTDPWNPDSDGDGIPDGQEDKNGNGVWEYYLGETNPLRTDSDGDGVPDNLDNCPPLKNEGQTPWFCGTS